MRIVVTGGAGFIGSHLSDRLIDRGHEVICVDNFITGSPAHTEALLKRGGGRFSLHKHNISEHVKIDGPVDAIYHMASPASPNDYLQYPIQTLKVGSLGTHNALGLAMAKRARFLLASTSEVYGDPEIHPQREDYWGNVNPIGPRGVYDEAKRFAEAITMAYHRAHGVNVHIVRIFNTYGPRMRIADGRAIPAFLSQAIRNEPLTVYGDGSQTRSFCYVSDLVEGLIRLMESEFHEPVNLGNPHEMTILELARRIKELTGTPAPIVHKPLPVDDPKVRKPDISRAREILKWEPKVSFDEGIRLTAEDFRQRIFAEAASR
ncbi:MAG: SDR family oxidoreductase [Candidatus Tectomicrobia bacterium]|uniref:UDP-glucuronate decarboxylase n=1 Tax=Tectimicrobiota bacterium TaxID=2528274 RepID=A0A932MRE9_UNCTE|nr:SDR family oxidoreductase [Candidatus Tectomicrobia bacterium]